MNRSVARLVAFFFLFATGADICHPCVEKLERLGLVPDHSQFPFRHSHHGTGTETERRHETPADQPAKDDDCFCCRSDVMVEPIVDVSPSEYSVRASFSANPEVLERTVAVLASSHSPPPSEFGLKNTLPPAKQNSERLQEILLEDLLPPPRLIRQS